MNWQQTDREWSEDQDAHSLDKSELDLLDRADRLEREALNLRGGTASWRQLRRAELRFQARELRCLARERAAEYS